MTRYTAHVRMGDRYWLVTVPEIDRVTQARTLAEVEPMARDLIAIMTGADPDEVDLGQVIELPEEVREHLDRAEQLRRAEAEARAQAAAEARAAVRQLRVAGVSSADIARALGISKQRVSQLTRLRDVSRAAGRGGLRWRFRYPRRTRAGVSRPGGGGPFPGAGGFHLSGGGPGGVGCGTR